MYRILLIFAGALGCVLVALAGTYLYFLHTSPPSAPPGTAPIQHGSVRVDGLERTYRAYVPADVPPHPPLLLAFHGSRADGETMREMTGYAFERLADEHGFIAVYPDGYERHWNDCRASGPYAANTLNVDDPAFVRTLIRHFADDYDIDTTRVFATGFSNGGHMAYRLALEMPHTVRAVAAIAANLPTPDNLDCTPSGEPVSVLIMTGTRDPLNPFDGGEVNLHGFLKRGTVQSAQASAEYFSRLAKGDAVASAHTHIQGGEVDGTIHRTTWAAPERPTVSLYAHSGGHTIPQPYYRFPRLLGKTPTDPDALAEIWDFFQAQTVRRTQAASAFHVPHRLVTDQPGRRDPTLYH